MKVKLLANLGTIEFPATPYKDGEIHAVPKALGERLVSRHLAVVVEEEPIEEAAPAPIRKKPVEAK